MARSLVGAGLAAGLVLGLPGLAEAAPRPAKAERRAMDIRAIDATSTANVLFAEIAFRGSLEARLGRGALRRSRVRVELVPASGPATVISDRGRKPTERRRGTSGRFDVARDERVLRVLAEELPAPIERVVVTTSGRPRAAAAQGAGDEVEPLEWDELIEEAQFIDSDEELGFARERGNERLDEARTELERAERQSDVAIDEIDKARRDLIRAESGAEAREARERWEKAKKELERLVRRRRTLRANIRLLERWLTFVAAGSVGTLLRQCNDTFDNGDPEDALADHPADPGCLDGFDNDEKDTTIPLTCPAPGAQTGSYATLNTPQSNGFTGYLLRAPDGAELARGPADAPPGTASTPAPLPGALCGPDVDVRFRYVVYTDGDPFALPDPPPGEFAICVFVEAANPSASGNPGGQQATIGMAVGTAPR